MQVCLALFANRGIVRSEPGRHYRLMKKGLTRDELARAGQSYRERQERDLLRQRQMVEYAETRKRRWRTLIDHFGGDGLPEEGCDNCAPAG